MPTPYSSTPGIANSVSTLSMGPELCEHRCALHTLYPHIVHTLSAPGVLGYGSSGVGLELREGGRVAVRGELQCCNDEA